MDCYLQSFHVSIFIQSLRRFDSCVSSSSLVPVSSTVAFLRPVRSGHSSRQVHGRVSGFDRRLPLAKMGNSVKVKG